MATDILRKAQAVEDRFEALLDASPDGILVTDADGRIEMFNAAAERLLGYSESDIVGHSFDRLVEAGHRDRPPGGNARAVLDALSTRPGESPREFIARRSDDTALPVELTVGRTRGDDYSFIVVIRDITRRHKAAAALARSESNLRMSQSLAHLGSFELSYPEAGDAYWSDEVFRILNRDPAKGPLIISELLAAVHPDDQDRVRKAAAAAARQGGVLRVEYRILHPDGSSRRVETHARIIADRGPGQWRVNGTVLDVSDRYRFEQALRQERDRAESYLDLVGVMVVALDTSGNITLINDQGLAILGCSEEDVLGRNFFQLFVSSADRAAALSRFAGALQEGDDGQLELLWLNTVGSGRRLVRWRNQQLTNADGEPEGLLCAGEDITEQQQTENDLKRAEEELRLTFHYAPIGMATLDIDGVVTSVNQALCGMLCASEQALLGRPMVDFAHPDDRATAESMRLSLLRGDVEYLREETRYQRSDGSIMSGVVRYSLARDLRNRPLMFVVQVVDRTEQLEAELEIRLQRESLAQAARLGTMGEMAAAIAHELNQPLTAISSYAQACHRMMESGSIQAKDIKEILSKVHAQARRAGHVIQGLRSFVKQRAVNRQATDLHRVLRDVSMLAELDARANGIVMQVETPDALPRVQADPVQLQQVLLNLIRNGVDAMADGQAKKPLIEIRAAMEQIEEVSITVTDYGPGISTDDAENLFEPFFTTKKEGMGMGLSLSRSIVEAHGGRLEFSAHPEGGAVFSVTLPTLPETDS